MKRFPLILLSFLIGTSFPSGNLQSASGSENFPGKAAMISHKETASYKDSIQKSFSAIPENTVHYTTDSFTMQEQIVLNLLNQDRSRYGLSKLAADPALSRIARIKSRDMNENHYFSHRSPTYGSAADMLRYFGYDFNSVSENIAHHATVEKAHAAFLSSPSHRINMMGSHWQKAGIGVWQDSQGFFYVTQLFAR